MVTEVNFIVYGFLFFYILYLFLWRKVCKESVDWVFSLIGNFIVSVFTIFILISADQKEVETYYKYYCNIHSLKNSNDVSGSFVLGSGNIEQVEYYYYYFKDVNGYFKRGKKEVNKTVIEEEENATPHIERKHVKNMSRTGFIESYVDNSLEEYKIVVPTGTVINKFEVY